MAVSHALAIRRGFWRSLPVGATVQNQPPKPYLINKKAAKQAFVRELRGVVARRVLRSRRSAAFLVLLLFARKEVSEGPGRGAPEALSTRTPARIIVSPICVSGRGAKIGDMVLTR